MRINIRLMNEGEIPFVNEVYNNAYGNIRPDNYFIWEFIKGPWGKAIYVIAEDLDRTDNKIIGTQSAIPIMMTDGKQHVLTAKSEDTFVHPEYRGHKLFDRMYELLFDECKKAGINYIWGFTFARKPFEKIGFSIPFDTVQGLAIHSPFKSYKILSSFNVENKFKQKISILGGSFISWFKFFLKSQVVKSEALEINPTFIKSTILFSKFLSENKNTWSINQDSNYFQWRIIDNPYENKYLEISSVEIGKNISLIFNLKKSSLAYLEQIVFDQDVDETYKVNFIVNSTKFLYSKFNISLIRYWGFPNNICNKDEINLLKKAGYLFVKKGTSFVWKSLLPIEQKQIDTFEVYLSRLFTQGNR